MTENYFTLDSLKKYLPMQDYSMEELVELSILVYQMKAKKIDDHKESKE